MSKNPAISLRSRWLSERLKQARQRAKYSLTDAGEYLQMDHTTLSRFEKGTHRIRRSYVKDLLDFYGVSDQRERDFLLRLSEDTWRKDWTDMDALDLPIEFIDYTWLESKSERICIFEPLLIHGLLQTPSYVEALTKYEQGEDVTRAEITRVIDVRKARQRILVGESPTRLSIIFEEPAIRRPIGGVTTLKEQLQYLLDVAQQEHIEVRVLPTSTKTDPGHRGPFTIFEMPDPYPEIAYVENLAGRIFIEDESKVDRFRNTYDEIHRLALGPRKSLHLIEDVMKDLP